MKHPLFKNPAYLIWYSAFWIILSVVQFFLEIRIIEASIAIILIDVLISNVLFALLGLGVWYVVANGNTDNHTQMYVALYHLFAMLFIVSFWMWLSGHIVQMLFPDFDIRNYRIKIMPSKAGLGALIYILISVFYYTFFFYDKLKEKSKEETRLKELVTQTQLSALKSQINPHFLFNSLNSVSYLTIAEPEKAQKMVIELSSFLRYSLKHKENQLVPLSQEIDHIKLYLEIEKVRFGDKLQANFNIDECKECTIPNMILQPLYENAVKYGVYETTSQVVIQTEAKRVDDTLVFTMSNNYDPDAVVKKGEGIGIRNIRHRLGLVYGDATLLSIQNENQIFKVTLTIPQK